MNAGRDVATILVALLAVAVLFAVPPAVAVFGLVAGAMVGIVTFLAVYAGDLGSGAGAVAGWAAAATTVIVLGVLGLATWIGPGVVLVLAVGGVAVMVQLGRRVLRRPCG